MDQVLVAWLGQDEKHATWVARSQLLDCDRLLLAYTRGESVTEVTRILGRRCFDGQVMHLVEWREGERISSFVFSVFFFSSFQQASPHGSRIKTWSTVRS